VRCRPIPPATDSFEHVAEVAHERAGDRGSFDPSVGCANLETTRGVLSEQGEEPVVGVLGDAPGTVGGLDHRVVEDPKQHRRIRGHAPPEVVGLQVEPDRDAAKEIVPEIGHRVDESQHEIA